MSQSFLFTFIAAISLLLIAYFAYVKYFSGQKESTYKYGFLGKSLNSFVALTLLVISSFGIAILTNPNILQTTDNSVDASTNIESEISSEIIDNDIILHGKIFPKVSDFKAGDIYEYSWDIRDRSNNTILSKTTYGGIYSDVKVNNITKDFKVKMTVFKNKIQISTLNKQF